MFKSLTPLMLAAMMAVAPAAWAQETTTETPAAEAPAAEAPAAETPAAEAPAAEAPATLIEQTEAAAGPQVGQPYIKETFGDWAIRCVTVAEGQGEDPCQLYQLLKDTAGNNVAEIVIVKLTQNNGAVAGATIVAPLETLLPERLTLTIDASEPRRYEFLFCNGGGCVVRTGLSDADVAQLKRGAKATLRLVPAGSADAEVLLDVSLTGFTAAYDALQ